VQLHLRLTGTKPGRKFTIVVSIRSIHKNYLQSTSFSLNHYPCNFYLRLFLDMRSPTHFLSITIPMIDSIVTTKWRHSPKQKINLCLQALSDSEFYNSTTQSNSNIKAIREWLTNNKDRLKSLIDSFVNCGFNSKLGLESSFI